MYDYSKNRFDKPKLKCEFCSAQVDRSFLNKRKRNVHPWQGEIKTIWSTKCGYIDEIPSEEKKEEIED